jgi:site-specific DNA-methyltransferase (adenine-specific)
MKIDIVVGNPPYNRKDDQLRFAIAGYQLATDCTSMIIPAKWQNKTGSINEEFRDRIVPHMKEIVFMPNVVDAFNIMEASGVTYYKAEKNVVYDIVKIRNVCRANKFISGERERALKIRNEICLDNAGYDIVNKLGSFSSYVPSVHDIDEFNLYINRIRVCGGGNGDSGAFTLSDITGNGNIISKSYIFTKNNVEYHHYSTKELGIPNCGLLFSCKTTDELKSFISYCYSKFVRFLIFCSIAGLGNVEQDNWWRFVPNQKFDHIFTDKELYAKYNLTEEMINVIEKTIKERRIKDAFKFIG